jgi:two-component system cell cycle response regulator DivK
VRFAESYDSIVGTKAKTSVEEAVPLVLVVDDYEDARIVYEQALRHYGMHVETAASAEEGLASTRARVPDVVVMDLAMPGTDGWETIRQLRTDPRMESVRILVVTGFDQPEHAARAIEAGADAVCIKPCVPSDLVDKLRALLSEDPPPKRTGKRRKHVPR